MRSDQIKKGVERAPNRSLLYALGYTEEELSRPLVGIVSSWNEIVPGHMDLDKIVEAVKAGVRAAGGTPVVFPAIAVCDGIAMGHIGMKYSLVTRDLIADSTEAMATAHQFDGLVMVPNCDKNVPGLLMAAARLNIPTIFCSGGPCWPGGSTTAAAPASATCSRRWGPTTPAPWTRPASGSTRRTPAPLRLLLRHVHRQLHELPHRGHRHGPAGQRHHPCPLSARRRLAKHAGMQIMELIQRTSSPGTS